MYNAGALKLGKHAVACGVQDGGLSVCAVPHTGRASSYPPKMRPTRPFLPSIAEPSSSLALPGDECLETMPTSVEALVHQLQLTNLAAFIFGAQPRLGPISDHLHGWS